MFDMEGTFDNFLISVSTEWFPRLHILCCCLFMCFDNKNSMEWNEMVRCGISKAFGRIHIKKCGWKHLTMDETDTENKKYDEIAKKNSMDNLIEFLLL